MKYFVPLCLFALVAGLFFALGGIGETKPNLQVASGELNFWGDWSINPCKYTYGYWEATRVSTTISNLSNREAEFDLGDGNITVISANGNLTYSYQIPLKGQTERIRITKLSEGQSGLSIQEALVLKIQMKGGD